MPLFNKDTIKAWLGANNFQTKTPEVDGQSEAVKQIENIIFQNTLIPIPADITDAIPTLQNVACALFVWFTSGTKDTLDMWYYQRLKEIKTDALTYLEDLRTGKKKIYGADGIVIETGFTHASTFYCNSENRSERV